MTAPPTTCFALRGSAGVWTVDTTPEITETKNFPKYKSPCCRVMTYSDDGSLHAVCDSTSVKVLRTADFSVALSLPLPRVTNLCISPCNKLLATCEPYTVTKDRPAGSPNIFIWDIESGRELKSFMRKKMKGWQPQWTVEEAVCSRHNNNEIHFFKENNFDTVQVKLHLQKIEDFELTKKSGPPYYIAAYAPGSKGHPSSVRVFKYPNFGGVNSAVCHKSFYKSERVEMLWNDAGTALVVLTLTETATADSYYGEQGLHFMDVKGESCIVPRPKSGPIYSVQWSPSSTSYCVVYGSMPSKATLYNLKSDPIFDFGTGPRNTVLFSPHGNMLCLAGFGNLRGVIEVWCLADQDTRLVANISAPDTTHCDWSPDSRQILTATTSPRLRVGNGFRLWKATGEKLAEYTTPGSDELWDVAWQPAPRGTYTAPVTSAASMKAASNKIPEKPKAYVPPAMRNQTAGPTKSKFREEFEPPSNAKTQVKPEMSKSALKRQRKKESEARRKLEAETANDAARTSAVPGATPVPGAGPVPGATPVAGVSPVPRGSEVNSSAGDHKDDPPVADKTKRIRNLKKKLRQIESLKELMNDGTELDPSQLQKLKTEAVIIQEIEELEL